MIQVKVRGNVLRKVNLSRSTDSVDPLPAEVAGVPVRVEIVAAIRQRSSRSVC